MWNVMAHAGVDKLMCNVVVNSWYAHGTVLMFSSYWGLAVCEIFSCRNAGLSVIRSVHYLKDKKLTMPEMVRSGILRPSA
jgi:hypothetical protein